jgi:hypothetical protein
MFAMLVLVLVLVFVLVLVLVLVFIAVVVDHGDRSPWEGTRGPGADGGHRPGQTRAGPASQGT